jgi:carbamoyl-phosphate synthase large subunit
MTERDSGYRAMPRPRLGDDALSLRAIHERDIEAVRLWRNAQMDVLRQSEPISPDAQVRYFAEKVWPEKALREPMQILLAIECKGVLIGYGGLVHISWPYRRAEISFLLKPKLEQDDFSLVPIFTRYLLLIQELAFQDLGLHRLTTETYEHRTNHIKAMEAAGHRHEGTLREHVLIDGQPTDALVHGILASDWRQELAVRSGTYVVSIPGSRKAAMARDSNNAGKPLDCPVAVVAADADQLVATVFDANDFREMPRLAKINTYRSLVGSAPVYDQPQAIGETVVFERSRFAQNNVATKRPLNILVSSASAKIPLVQAMQAAVRQIDPTGHVLAGDLNAQALTSHVADGFWAMPHTQDESLDAIVSGLKQRQISVVLPTRDSELMFWARHAARLDAEGIQVVVSEPEPVERCLDKLAFARFGATQQLPFIPASDRLDDIAGDCLVVKERFGAGSRSIGLRLDRAAAAVHAKTLESPIFQPQVDGMEISIDAWLNRQHQVKGLVLRRRDRVVHGESQITTTFSDAHLEGQVLAILQALQLSGPVVMQAMVAANGSLQVIECNPRFGGASTTSIAAGLASLHWSLLQATGADLAAWPFHRIPGELRQIRVPTDLYVTNPDI